MKERKRAQKAVPISGFLPVEDIGHDVADVTEGPAAAGGGDLLLPRLDCGT